MRFTTKARTRARKPWKIGKGLLHQRHPVLAHIVPMRRCNLACTYCNELDDVSPPVSNGSEPQHQRAQQV